MSPVIDAQVVGEEAAVDALPKYPASVLMSYDNGVGMDLRVRLAVEFLKSPGPWSGASYRDAEGKLCDDWRQAARRALDTATDLLALADERGLLTPVPDHAEIPSHLRRHLERNGKAQAIAQVAGGRAMAEEGGSIGHGGLPPGFPLRGGH